MVEKSHGSQDLYPTMLVNQYDFSPNAKTVTQVVANLGAIAGGKDEMAQVRLPQLIMS